MKKVQYKIAKLLLKSSYYDFQKTLFKVRDIYSYFSSKEWTDRNTSLN